MIFEVFLFSFFTIAVIAPLVSIVFLPIGIFTVAKTNTILRTNYQNKMMLLVALAVTIQCGFRLASAYVPMTEIQWTMLNGFQTLALILVNTLAARASSRRLSSLGRKKYWAMLHGPPFAGLVLGTYLALTIKETKPSA